MRKTELLAPAGDFEKLKAALHFGCDAVYLSGEAFGMRKASRNFDRKELQKAVELVHEAGKKIHVTLNIVPHDSDFQGLEDYVRFLEEIRVDAVIVSDPGIFMTVKEHTDLEIHMSTQASITNTKTVIFWANQGAKRIVLARELSLEEIREIRRNIPADVELECFVHGAMCISYSGRCLLSNYMTGRDANQGDCAQACRWKYHLVEEKRPGEYFPIVEDEGGTFIMNSKDLCLLPHLKALADAGVDSFKIEGRVKSRYYVSTVIHAYRQAIDAMEEGLLNDALIEKLVEELEKTSHRNFTTGFLFGKPDHNAQNYTHSSYTQNYDFIGVVKGYDAKSGVAIVEERNRISVGDNIEIFGPNPGFQQFVVESMQNMDGETIQEVNEPMVLFQMAVPEEVMEGDLLRRKKER